MSKIKSCQTKNAQTNLPVNNKNKSKIADGENQTRENKAEKVSFLPRNWCRDWDKNSKFLNLILIWGLLGISAFGCSEMSETPVPNQTMPTAIPTTSPKASPKPTPQTTIPTTSPKASPKPTPQTAIPQTASPTPSPQVELPKPNQKGDYQRTSHKYWQTVDSDPKGLNCRMGEYSFQAIQDPGSNITLDILNWNVVGTFKKGTNFEIDSGPAGFGSLTDVQKRPWFYVKTSSDSKGPSNCFVRANSRLVKPVMPK